MTAVLPLGYLLVGPLTAWLGNVHFLVWGGLAGTAAAVLALLPGSTRTLTWTGEDPDGLELVQRP